MQNDDVINCFSEAGKIQELDQESNKRHVIHKGIKALEKCLASLEVLN